MKCANAILLIMYIVIIFIIIGDINSTLVEYKENKIDYYEILNPDMNQPIYKVYTCEEEIVREYNIKINKEMDIISQFIKSRNNRVPLLVADQISNSIVTRCKENDVPNELIIGIIEVESLYDPYAIGPPVGGNHMIRARGLGQILDTKCSKDKILKDKLHNIDYNIEYAINIIKDKLKATKGDLDKSLYCYVGKDKTYAAKVFKTMGEFRYFRSQRI